ncbi:hypothetical protein BKA63DRAFT_572304 [Paraphoma chrysanthemicola]|nr:hypothetical protein BKA63DRAFT_572304 [Paraphoma chrysanthemicola]
MVNWLHILPRELRDIIYEYALTENGGLAVDMWDDFSHALVFRAAKENGTREDSNQLRLVCRQLHSETNSLGLHYNDITLKDARHGRDVWAYAQFARLVKSVAPTQLAAITRIILLDYFAELVDTRVLPRYGPDSAVQQHCRNYPGTDVVVRLNERYTRHTIACMNALHFTKHGAYLFAVISESLTARLAAAYISCAYYSLHFERPPNLRFSATIDFE